MGSGYWNFSNGSNLYYINDNGNISSPFKIGNLGDMEHRTLVDSHYLSWLSRKQKLWGEFTISAESLNSGLYSELINSVSKPDEPPEIDKTEFDKIIGGEAV